MAFNALIAQGVQPIGADLPQIANMLNQRRQQQFQNSLATNQDARAQGEYSANMAAAADQRQRARSQQDAQQAYTEAQYIKQAKDEELPGLLARLPHIAQAAKAAGVTDANGLRQFAAQAEAQAGAMLGKGPDLGKVILAKPGEQPLLDKGGTVTPIGSPIAEPVKPESVQPMDELAKLNADYKAGRLSEADYKARRVLMTTRAPNSANTPGDPTSVENTAQMIAKGQIPMLTGFALRSPWGQSVVSRVRDLNPDYSAAGFTTGAASLKDFTSGKSAQITRSLNVGISHLNTLSDLSEGLDNTASPAFNKLANIWKQQTGQAAPTSFNAARQIVAAEVVKAITGAGGGVSDREEAQNIVSAANSPAQLKQAIQTIRELFAGQLNGLQQQYEQGTGRKDFTRFLSPETVRELQPYSGTPAAGGAPVGAPINPTAEVTATGPNGQKLALRNGQWVPVK